MAEERINGQETTELVSPKSNIDEKTVNTKADI